MMTYFWPIFAGLFFVFYLALGASIFSAIEAPIEKQVTDNLRQKKEEFLQAHSCITGKCIDTRATLLENAPKALY
jgi:hypothetical protein